MSPVKIVWVDSTNYNSGWTYDTDFPMPAITTIGYLVFQDDERVIISHSCGYNDMHYDGFVIPKRAVMSIERIDIASKKQAERE